MLPDHLRFLIFFFLAFCLAYSCASSDQQPQKSSYPNQVALTKPGDAPHIPGKIYIDSVKQVSQNDTKTLLVSGSFSDGCTHLESMSHSITDSVIILKITAWREKEAVCTQALVPFSFLYDKLSSQELSRHSQVSINGKTYSF